jgi:biotin synthase
MLIDPIRNAAALLRANGSAQEILHEQARCMREERFGNRVFVRGVIEVSNFCRENCAYCGMRRDNRALHRYRLSLEPLRELLINHRPASITDLNIQTGEDPIALREIVLPLICELRRQTSLGISVCLGTHSEADYRALREAGADYYIMKIETGDERHYREVQSPGTLQERIAAIRSLAATGWTVSSGLIVGLPGQTDEQIVSTLGVLAELPLTGCSVSPFIPGEQTPLSEASAGDLEMTLNALAIMRLASPERIIPAVSAMTLTGADGYARAIRAGANLATINLTPSEERRDYLLYKRDRQIMTEQRILHEIEASGCEPSPIGVSSWLASRSVRDPEVRAELS